MVRFLCKPDIAAYMPAAAAHSRCWHMPAVRREYVLTRQLTFVMAWATLVANAG